MFSSAWTSPRRSSGKPAPVQLEGRVEEGEWRDQVPATVANVAGPARALLAAERTALNFLCHLSGVATLTATFVGRSS